MFQKKMGVGEGDQGVRKRYRQLTGKNASTGVMVGKENGVCIVPTFAADIVDGEQLIGRSSLPGAGVHACGVGVRHTQRDTQRHTQTHRQTDRQTDTHTHTHTSPAPNQNKPTSSLSLLALAEKFSVSFVSLPSAVVDVSRMTLLLFNNTFACVLSRPDGVRCCD